MKVMCITECSYSMGSTNHQFNIGDKYQLSYIQPVEEDDDEQPEFKTTQEAYDYIVENNGEVELIDT